MSPSSPVARSPSHQLPYRHLDSIASQNPDREALVVPHQNVRWTYAEMMERANRLAARFLDLGLAPGDRVGIWAPNCSEWCVMR